MCDQDVECDDGLVCARGDHFCVTPDQVRSTHTEWTINGQPANDGTCAGFDFYIQFQSDDFGFSPVPCDTGVFSVDKLPVRYRRVEVGVEGGSGFDGATFNANGDAVLDIAL